MNRLSQRVYKLAYGKHGVPGDDGNELNVSGVELAGMLLETGGLARLRGLLRFWRLGKCGGGLRLGRGVKTPFAKHLQIGNNALICDNVNIHACSKDGFIFGDNIRIRENVWITAGSDSVNSAGGMTIGDNAYIGPFSVLNSSAGLQIGRDVTIGAHVDIVAESCSFEKTDVPINQQSGQGLGIVIEDDCWIGNRVTIDDGVRIGRSSVIAAGSVVSTDIPEFSVAIGAPARVIRDRRYKGPVILPEGLNIEDIPPLSGKALQAADA